MKDAFQKYTHHLNNSMEFIKTPILNYKCLSSQANTNNSANVNENTFSSNSSGKLKSNLNGNLSFIRIVILSTLFIGITVAFDLCRRR
jgi:hypothetical protein